MADLIKRYNVEIAYHDDDGPLAPYARMREAQHGRYVRIDTVERLLARIAALEAGASKGERMRALLADIHRTSPKPYRLDRPGLTHGQAAEIGYGALRDAIQTRVAVALLPEAPAQRELASGAANQLSGSEVGFHEAPVREGE